MTEPSRDVRSVADPAPALDSYLLCATARSGSTLLCGLLDSSGVAGHPESYFIRRGLDEYADRWGIGRPPDGRIDGAYVSAALAAGRTPNGVFGGRIMGETMPELLADLAVTSDPGTSDLDLLAERMGRLRFVHLRRLDTVAQAVSWARALPTHFWHPGEVVLPGAQDPHYDEDLIGDLVARIDGSERWWAAWFADHGVVPCEVTYEQLAADPAGTGRRVLDVLGLRLPSGRQLETRHRRQADQVNAEWIAEFRSRGTGSLDAVTAAFSREGKDGFGG